MENYNKFRQFFDEEVKMIAYCPMCDADLNPIKAKVVENKEDLNLVHIKCNKCSGNILAIILRTNQGISSLGLVTDLNYNDVFKFKDKQGLADTDLFSLHQALREKNITKKILQINR